MKFIHAIRSAVEAKYAVSYDFITVTLNLSKRMSHSMSNEIKTSQKSMCIKFVPGHGESTHLKEKIILELLLCGYKPFYVP